MTDLKQRCEKWLHKHGLHIDYDDEGNPKKTDLAEDLEAFALAVRKAALEEMATEIERLEIKDTRGLSSIEKLCVFSVIDQISALCRQQAQLDQAQS